MIKLIEINENGTVAIPINGLTDLAKEVMSSTEELYEAAGYVPPWMDTLRLRKNGVLAHVHLNPLRKITGWKLHIHLS